ncbi:MAG: hypothetical protein PWQ70_1628 [Clostridiales bacterium]|nr:hypothetical protein [Clostridiales bacterium]
MTVIKSFSVGDGDMFYINHSSDNFTIIDCYLNDDNKESIVNEIVNISKNKGIKRFISTHPDDDHIGGLKYLDDKLGIVNFYCVKNEATKTDDTEDFKRYCELRDDTKKAFYLEKGCSRKWLNKSDDERGAAEIHILWPVVDNEYFQDALKKAKEGKSLNNISPIIQYKFNKGVTVVWMGDIEKDFLEKIRDDLDLPKAHIVFAPHHGRDSGKIPKELLEQLDPQIIIIGEAPSKDLNYYQGYNTITQNTAGDIILDCITGKVHIYVSNSKYSVDFLDNEKQNRFNYYLGTLNL